MVSKKCYFKKQYQFVIVEFLCVLKWLLNQQAAVRNHIVSKTVKMKSNAHLLMDLFLFLSLMLSGLLAM